MSAEFKEGDVVLVIYLGDAAKVTWLRAKDLEHAESMRRGVTNAINAVDAKVVGIDATDGTKYIRIDSIVMYCTYTIPALKPTVAERIATAMEKTTDGGESWKG